MSPNLQLPNAGSSVTNGLSALAESEYADVGARADDGLAHRLSTRRTDPAAIEAGG